MKGGFSESFWTFSPVSLIKYTAVSVAWSVNEFLQVKMVVKLSNFYLKSKDLNFFCLVQNGPVVVWIAYLGRGGSFRSP